MNHIAVAKTGALWRFPAIYLGWAYLWWLPLFWSDESVWSPPNLLFFLAGGASPLLAALLLAWRDGGRARLADLWHRLVDVRRIPLRWWLFIFLFWLLFDLLLGGIAVWLGVTRHPFAFDPGLFTAWGELAFLLLLSFIFPAVEEVGLRGYFLDALQQRFSTGVAATLNGITWALWHTPFVWFPGYYANTTFNPSLTWWLPMIVCTTLLITQVYRQTGRSILAALCFHAMMNFTGEVLGISSEMYPFVLSGYVLAAIGLLLHWRREHRPDRPMHASGHRQ